jgi:hypothetical protein
MEDLSSMFITLLWHSLINAATGIKFLLTIVGPLSTAVVGLSVMVGAGWTIYTFWKGNQIKGAEMLMKLEEEYRKHVPLLLQIEYARDYNRYIKPAIIKALKGGIYTREQDQTLVKLELLFRHFLTVSLIGNLHIDDGAIRTSYAYYLRLLFDGRHDELKEYVCEYWNTVYRWAEYINRQPKSKRDCSQNDRSRTITLPHSMTPSDIAHHRLRNQHISAPAFEAPRDEVGWLLAVQAQDYAAAKWGVGLRLCDADDDRVEHAFAEGSILRTHVLRPTWHFVTPEDIRWMVTLTAPRINTALGYHNRRLELDEAVFKRSNAVLRKALRDGKYLTRDELRRALADAGIHTDDLLRSTHIMMRAELDLVICSGPRRGKQFTYALLDERVPETDPLTRDEALATLAERFFTSHGPATVHDLAKWSGLTVTDASAGLEAVKGKLACVVAGHRTYWLASSTRVTKPRPPKAYLLPCYDEYTVGYKDNSAVFDSTKDGNLIFNPTVVINGRVAGTWKRTIRRSDVEIGTSLFAPLSSAESCAVEDAVDRYGRFVGLRVSMQTSPAHS